MICILLPSCQLCSVMVSVLYSRSRGRVFYPTRSPVVYCVSLGNERIVTRAGDGGTLRRLYVSGRQYPENVTTYGRHMLVS